MPSRSEDIVGLSEIDVPSVRRFIEDWRSGEGAPVEAPDTLEQADLLALSWLGGGLYAAPEWCEARFEAQAAQCGRTWARLMETPALMDRLEAGLAKLREGYRLH